jgi:hypothetical protein
MTTRAVVVGGGRKGAGQAAEPLRWRRLPSRTRSWWPTSVRSRTSDALLPSCCAPHVVVTDNAAAVWVGSALSGSPGTMPTSSSSAVVIDGNYYNDDDDNGLGGRTTDKVGEREGEEEDQNLLLAWLSHERYRINSPSVACAAKVDCEEMGKPYGQGLDEDGVVGEQNCGGTHGCGCYHCRRLSSDATSRAIPPSTVNPAIVYDNHPLCQGIEERRVRPPKQQ